MKEFCTTKLCIIALYITLLKKLKIFTKSIGLILYPIFIAPCPFLSPNMVNQTTTLVSKPEKKIMYKTYINILRYYKFFFIQPYHAFIFPLSQTFAKPLTEKRGVILLTLYILPIF